MRRRGATLAPLACLALLGSCGGAEPSSRDAASLGRFAPGAWLAGEREFVDSTRGAPVRFRERVTHGPEGAAFELLSVDGKDRAVYVAEGRGAAFEALAGIHAQRAEFFRKYRDFQVRDAALAARNYLFSSAGRAEVAGVPVEIHRVEPKSHDRPTYEVSVDPRTESVLAYRAFDPAGRPFAELEYRMVDSTEPAPPVRTAAAKEKVGVEQARARLGLPLPQPLELPDGIEFVESELISLGSFSYFGSLFTDGVQAIILLAYSADAFGGTPRPPTPDGDPIEAQVDVHEDGTLTIMDLEALGVRVVLLGQVEPEVLAAIVRSLDFAQ